ncbi:MAG: hypothetical protein M1827_005750 [Pycnora praestabilis]|nr:MAG: hypothetical protein M1827_005750 [Pycnora praestabilis]
MAEAVKMADYLGGLTDPARHLQAVADDLRSTASDHTQQHVQLIYKIIERCEASNFKCLEVEYRLMQVEFYLLARSLNTPVDLNTKASFTRISELCRRFPDTAGKFTRTFGLLRDITRGQRRTERLYKPETLELWRKWGNYKTGYYTKCPYKHPYSAKTFPEGCPECGREVELQPSAVEPVDYDYEQHLDKEGFLIAINRGDNAA